MTIELTPELTDPRERFVNFYKMFQDSEGRYKYRDLIGRMAIEGKRSLVIDFDDLLGFDPDLALMLEKEPSKVIEAASRAIGDVMRVENMEYARRIQKFHARFRNLPEVLPLRAIRSEHIGKFVMLEGIVIRATNVKQLLVEAVFQCQRCEEKIPVPQHETGITPPLQCPNPSCQRKGPFKLLPEESTFLDWQRITIQEKPEELPPGQVPRSIDAVLKEDLVDTVRPGDRVLVTGILKPQQEVTARSFKPATFSPYLEVNHIEAASKAAEEIEITPEDEEKILELARDPLIHQRIISSIAPSIHGYEEIKEAIAYLLFGGVPKVMPDGVRIRGDIHVLLIGDPGTAKSQLLKYVARIAPRGVYTSGRGSTAAGLTAAVLRDKATGEYVLEAGALVLADGGVACIDEIDKMRPEDRVAIHEAMEQQTVSIAKAGIVAQLNARCAVLAAANPTLGRYSEHKTLAENIADLPVTILSRFDMIFPLMDRPDEQKDRALSEHILKLHRKIFTPGVQIIPPDLLRKYIAYARKNIKPRLTPEAERKLQEFYLQMRKMGEGEGSPVPISARQLEALIRMTEARARMALREEVTEEDAEAVTKLMREFLFKVGMDRSTGRLDIDSIMLGRPKSVGDKLGKLLEILLEMEKEASGAPVRKEDFVERAIQAGLEESFIEKTLARWRNEGVVYEPSPGYIKRA
ncbi:MAG: minichromosome maintenance protein MCM [Candidatus Verstraetearchaeota archaeon]|nr:minichromosome maintenance protein MCM [Candidatus Verstraetearchaeota archaeon]